MMEDFNSLCVTSGNAKINAINGLCQDFKINLLCGCETQVDWRMVSQTRRFHNLFGAGSKTRIVAHNINERVWINQFGGCAIMAMGTLAPEVADLGVDSTGLGQWCWIHVGSGSKKTQIVMAYQPCNSGNTTTRNTLNDQHSQYFQALGDARSPRTIFYEDLVAQLLVWKLVDNDIVLMGDFNENVYTGRLACCLSQVDINLTELCWRHTGIPIPATFRTGSSPINGIFATPVIECVNTFILLHLAGVGDHRCFIVNLSSSSVIGSSFPNIVRCAAWKLHCKSPRMVRAYNTELTQLCKHHNMFHCMDTILRLSPHLTDDDFSLLMDAWDKEFKEFMLHLEVHCSKYMMGHIEWSPEIGIWLNQRWLLHQVRLLDAWHWNT